MKSGKDAKDKSGADKVGSASNNTTPSVVSTILQEPVKEARRPFVWGMIGHNTTGKTPTAISIAKAWKEARPGYKVIGFDPQDKFTEAGVLDIRIFGNNPDWAKVLCLQHPKTKQWLFGNSLLILDDYRMLHANNSIDTGFLDLLALRVRMNMDIIFVCHNPKLILERLSYYTTHYSIFYTEAQMGSFESRIPKYLACQKAAVLINKYVREYGRGEYPNFPHIVVQAESDDLELINMDKKKVEALYEAA